MQKYQYGFWITRAKHALRGLPEIRSPGEKLHEHESNRLRLVLPRSRRTECTFNRSESAWASSSVVELEKVGLCSDVFGFPKVAQAYTNESVALLE